MLESKPAQTEGRLNSVPIYLPYKRDVIDFEVDCPVEGDFNYTPYDFFCLTTKLLPEIFEIFRKKLIINYETVRINTEMVYTVTFYDGDNFITISEESAAVIKELVDDAISNSSGYCSLFSLKHDYEGMPNEWIREIALWYPFDDKLNVTIYQDQILIDLSKDFDFKETYVELFISFEKWLSVAYEEGWIVDPSQDFIEKWELEQVYDNDQIYKPAWSDPRFALDKYKFLQSRTRGDTLIELEYPTTINSVQIYQICRMLITHGYRFCHFVDFTKILIEAKTLNECRMATSIFEAEMYVTYSKNVSSIPLSSYRREPTIVKELLRTGVLVRDIIMIPTTDKNYPYMGMILTPYGSPGIAKVDFMRLITEEPVVKTKE